ncbi:MAG TPA: hypothetical protein VGR73_06430 [Bryobacteraceae bacterium]|nr:hypothetical protein [Bryobacteraceae bacterium]
MTTRTVLFLETNFSVITAATKSVPARIQAIQGTLEESPRKTLRKGDSKFTAPINQPNASGLRELIGSGESVKSPANRTAKNIESHGIAT